MALLSSGDFPLAPRSPTAPTDGVLFIHGTPRKSLRKLPFTAAASKIPSLTMALATAAPSDRHPLLDLTLAADHFSNIQKSACTSCTCAETCAAPLRLCCCSFATRKLAAEEPQNVGQCTHRGFSPPHLSLAKERVFDSRYGNSDAAEAVDLMFWFFSARRSV